VVCGCFKFCGSPTSLDRVHRIFHTGGTNCIFTNESLCSLTLFLDGILTLENGTNRFYRNVGRQLQFCTA